MSPGASTTAFAQPATAVVYLGYREPHTFVGSDCTPTLTHKGTDSGFGYCAPSGADSSAPRALTRSTDLQRGQHFTAERGETCKQKGGKLRKRGRSGSAGVVSQSLTLKCARG